MRLPDCGPGPGSTTLDPAATIKPGEVEGIDLSTIVACRALFWIIVNPQACIFGGMATTAKPNRWQLTIGYDAATESVRDFTIERCIELVVMCY